MQTKLKNKISKLIKKKKTFNIIQTGKTVKILVEKHKQRIKECPIPFTHKNVSKIVTTFENGEMISKQIITKKR